MVTIILIIFLILFIFIPLIYFILILIKTHKSLKKLEYEIVLTTDKISYISNLLNIYAGYIEQDFSFNLERKFRIIDNKELDNLLKDYLNDPVNIIDDEDDEVTEVEFK